MQCPCASDRTPYFLPNAVGPELWVRPRSLMWIFFNQTRTTCVYKWWRKLATPPSAESPLCRQLLPLGRPGRLKDLASFLFSTLTSFQNRKRFSSSTSPASSSLLGNACSRWTYQILGSSDHLLPHSSPAASSKRGPTTKHIGPTTLHTKGAGRGTLRGGLRRGLRAGLGAAGRKAGLQEGA